MNRLWRAVIDDLTAHTDGRTTAEIATALKQTVDETRDVLTDMENDGYLYVESNSKGGRLLWFLDQQVIDIKTSDRFKEKERKCLPCGKMFMSSHAGNRICEKCKEDKEHNETVYDDIDNMFGYYEDGISKKARLFGERDSDGC